MNLPLFVILVAVVVSFSWEITSENIDKNINGILRKSHGRPQISGGLQTEGLEDEEKKLRGNSKTLFFHVSLRQISGLVQKILRRNRFYSKDGSPFYDCLKILTFLCVDQMFQSIPNVLFAPKKNEMIVENPRFFIDDYNLNEYVDDILNENWIVLAKERLKVFINQSPLKILTIANDDSLPQKGRGRRKDHRMLALIVMGFMIMASVLIPTGFQFLTVLGGKSLLMAKMALILSAINGLKKIAASNVGYGFYEAGGDGYHFDAIHHGFKDKLHQIGSP